MPLSRLVALKTLACLSSTALGAIAGFNYVSSGSVLHASDQPGLHAPTTISSAAHQANATRSGSTTQAEACPEPCEPAPQTEPCCQTPGSRASFLVETGTDERPSALSETPSEG
ncbi:MAG: hypothetical protein ACF8Q5_11895 [Phycisphaerales bacterium JB040]